MSHLIKAALAILFSVPIAIAQPNAIPEPEEPLPIVEQKPTLYPILEPVCSCESSYDGTATGGAQQYEKDGVTPRWGRWSPSDTGMCQINMRVHREETERLGLDITTEAGNIEFANYLYDKFGLKPWKPSESCWRHYIVS